MDLSKFKNLKEPFLLLLIGPPLSGKTYFYNLFLEKVTDNVVLISRDECVMEVYGSRNYTDAFKNVNQKQVDKLLQKKITDTNAQKKNTIVDMTHMSAKRRKQNLDYFTDDYYKMGVIFPILSDEEYEKRNKKRVVEENKDLPMHIVKRMISQYQAIGHGEGFDKVISI